MNKKKVMIVDDEKDFVELLKIQLEKEGYKIVVAFSGEECMKKLKTIRPDIILLDLMMPGLSGWEVCSKIKSDSKLKEILVVFLTAKVDKFSKLMGLKGADGYMEKPFDPLDLVDLIEKVTKK